MEDKLMDQNKTYNYVDTSNNKEYSIYFEIFENFLKIEVKEKEQNKNILYTSAFDINILKEKYKIFEVYDTEKKNKKIIS
jgi:hypothetical protein